ncbi:fungal-specific transcription factor domain-containing protein [Aspergillus californicus]
MPCRPLDQTPLTPEVVSQNQRGDVSGGGEAQFIRPNQPQPTANRRQAHTCQRCRMVFPTRLGNLPLDYPQTTPTDIIHADSDVLLGHAGSCHHIKEADAAIDADAIPGQQFTPNPSPSTTARQADPKGPGAKSLERRQSSGVGPTHATAPELIDNTAEVGGPHPRENGAANKRGRYVSNACPHLCDRTDAGGLAISPSGPVADLGHGPLNVSESLLQMMSRISELERDCTFLRSRLPLSHERDVASPTGSCSNRTPVEAGDDVDAPADHSFQGPPNLMNLIGLLSTTIAESDGSPSKSSRMDDHMPQAVLDWADISGSDARVMEGAERDTNFQDTDLMEALIATFFEQINPHYPSINENEFRSQMAQVAAPMSESPLLSKPDRYQLVALANLIIAEVRLLSDEWIKSEAVPGWANFCRSERILGRLIQHGNGNRLTIQCLIVKARYLMNLERGNAAYETICRAVRLCFQLGFHDTSSWGQCPPFEVVMRQRIFWTVFYLERGLALNCGYPYSIRELDTKVNLPAAYDDRELFPDQPLPPRTADTRSYAPNLLASVKWARLTAEIWDTLFAVNHAPVDPEFVPSMDARIVYTMDHFPSFFHSPAADAPGGHVVDQAPFIWHQGAIQRLVCILLPPTVTTMGKPKEANERSQRHQQLRLLLRQESLLSLEYDDNAARECQEIISSTLKMLQGPPAVGNAPVGRLSVVFYITVTLLPLVCLINGRRTTSMRPDAVACFRTQLEMLQRLGASVGMARHVLSNMQDIIAATKSVIHGFHLASGDVCPVPLYPRTMETPMSFPPEPFRGEDSLISMMDELLADPSLLDIAPTAGPWVGDNFSHQWMQMSDH